MMRRVWSRLAAVGAGVSLTMVAGAASASSGIESPEGGVELIGRGAAWLARADSPLAVYYNPAALAWQASGVHAGALFLFSKKCYTRSTSVDPSNGKSIGAPVSVPPDQGIPGPLLPGQAGPTDGGTLPSGTVCGKDALIPNPQLAATFRITDKLAIGLGVFAPHSTGKSDWGDSLSYTKSFAGMKIPLTQPSPQRYMLSNADALILNPTVSVAFAPTEYLAFGVGFIWGIATADFANFSESVSNKPLMGDVGDHARNDVRAELKAKDMFIPGFILSALWSAHPTVDVSAWFKWQDAIKGTGDLSLESFYWKTSGVRDTSACADRMLPAKCNLTDAPQAGTFKLNIPMEAKLGIRYHMPRANPEADKAPGWATQPGRRIRDPLSQDIFDVEVDFTWANNSAVKDLELSFDNDAKYKHGIPINDGTKTGVGKVPRNGNIPRNWRDVLGVRVGGDVVVIPNRLTLRTGGFYELKGQDDEYLNLDFNLGWKAGVGGGATVRLGPVDVSLGYQHTFFGTLDNGGVGKVYALSGDASGATSIGGATPVCGTDTKIPKIGPGCYRSWQAVNGGVLTQSMNEFGLSGTARW
jgi:long-chain fatty acid transport protein